MKYVKVPFTMTGYAIIPIADDMETYEALNEVEGNDGYADSIFIDEVLTEDEEVVQPPFNRKDTLRIYNVFNLKGVIGE